MRGEGRGDIELVVEFILSEAMSAPAASGRIMVELLIMPYFYMRGNGGRGGGVGGGMRSEGNK